MNACFLLALAAQRRNLQHDSANSPEESHTPCSGASLAAVSADRDCSVQSSDTVVVPIGALLALQRNSNAQSSTSAASIFGRRSLNAAAELAELPAPPAAARLPCDAAGITVAANPAPSCCRKSLSSCSSAFGTQECRICLSSGATEDLIQPCSCCGTLSYVHNSCLATWVEERGSLICELCGQRYKQPFAQALEPIVTAAMQRKKHTLTTSTGRVLEVTTPQRHMSRDEWVCLLLSMILLVISFVIISVTLSRHSASAAAVAPATAADAPAGAHAVGVPFHAAGMREAGAVRQICTNASKNCHAGGS